MYAENTELTDYDNHIPSNSTSYTSSDVLVKFILSHAYKVLILIIILVEKDRNLSIRHIYKCNLVNKVS